MLVSRMLARTPSAAKKRRWRARQRNGVVVLPIEVNEHDVAAAMIESGRLDERQALDRAELKRAAEILVREWAQRWRGSSRL